MPLFDQTGLYGGSHGNADLGPGGGGWRPPAWDPRLGRFELPAQPFGHVEAVPAPEMPAEMVEQIMTEFKRTAHLQPEVISVRPDSPESQAFALFETVGFLVEERDAAVEGAKRLARDLKKTQRLNHVLIDNLLAMTARLLYCAQGHPADWSQLTSEQQAEWRTQARGQVEALVKKYQ